MSKLLIATHNKAKFEEIKHFLGLLLPQAQIISLSDLNITYEPDETGKTFFDNAKIKAEYYGKISLLPTLADDGCLVIDSLGGEPGVKSNRWPGHRGSDKELITYCMDRMKKIEKQNRTARFETCLYFYDHLNKRSTFASGAVEGIISERSTKNFVLGYPYRSVFIVDGFNKFYTDLSEEEHEKINHRLKALNQIAQKLKTWYN